jgi:hypothetical protein
LADPSVSRSFRTGDDRNRLGRIGGRGYDLVRSFADEGALRYVRALLVRRESATRRIGTANRPYQSDA